MNNLLLNARTDVQVQAFLKSPSHALILVGPSGSGKLSLAEWLASALLGDAPEAQKNAYTKNINPADDTLIGIDVVREMEHFLRLKVPSSQTINRVVVLASSQLLSPQAQNALLKTLEEPPEGTVLILTVDHAQSLLPTIRSRSQQITVERPALEQLQVYFKEQGYEDARIKQVMSISGGLPGLAASLLYGEEHPLIPATEKARELLSQTVYERLTQVDNLSRQRGLCLDIFFILQQMAHLSLQSNNQSTNKRWQAILTASYEASEALTANVQTKLVLCNFMLRL